MNKIIVKIYRFNGCIIIFNAERRNRETIRQGLCKEPQSIKMIRFYLEAISKIGFWLKVKAGLSFNPQTYLSISMS